MLYDTCVLTAGHWSNIFPVYRCGIALALNKLSQWLRENQVTPIFLFFVPDALNDRHCEVRRCMLDAALSVLNTHGKVPSFTPAPETASFIRVRTYMLPLYNL